MAEIISGLVDRDGRIYEGQGFEVKKIDVGYEITFLTLKKPPTIVAQAWEIDDAITCVTVGYLPSPVKVVIATLDKDGRFVPNAFTFIAVSNG
ncbi:MAG: hypothetical protein QNJ51_17590 [Calothrix sp. MO_167.B12]|nr:hypothetical protein [Calothrix sp. MO_167.B12]